ncbi:MAG: hypothetical protein KF819_19995 [Labilithrix sp.]|nr:hypothetical protein [Labilithrix sp.]
MRIPLLVTAALLMAPASALASPKLEAEGLRLYHKKRYDEACAAFREARTRAVERRASLTLLLAGCSFKAGRPLATLRYLDEYESEVADPPPKTRELVDATRRAARAQTARVRVVAPEGAVVTIDGRRASAASDGAFDVTPGTHTIAVTVGAETASEAIDAEAGSVVEVRPMRDAAPKDVDESRDDHEREPPAAASQAPHAESASLLSPPTTTWPVYVAGAIGLTSLTAAAIIGGMSANADLSVEVAEGALARAQVPRSRCEAPTPDVADACASLRRNERLSRDLDGAVTTSLIVGITGMTLAAGWYFFAPKERTSITPWIGAGVGGASLAGRF